MSLARHALVASLALNGLLALAFLLPLVPVVPVVELPSPSRTAIPGPRVAAVALLALEPAALLKELEALGLPRAAIEALVLARIHARHDARRRELVLATNRLPWWQTVTAGINRLSLLTPEERKELRHLAAVARSDAIRLLGPAALDRDGVMAARYRHVGETSAVFLDALVRDYEDIRTMLREDMRGLRTASDREQERYVESERLRDLARLLTPEEREIFELRTSSAAVAMQGQLRTFAPSETEYRALRAVYREFEETHPGHLTVEGQMQRRRLHEYPDYLEKIRATLGEARYADWSLDGQRYTQALARLAPDFGLTSAAVKEISTMLRDTAARSWSVGEDASLTYAQQREALNALAANARALLRTRLGDTGSAALSRDVAWLDLIEKGNSVQVDGYSTRSQLVHQVIPSDRPRP